MGVVPLPSLSTWLKWWPQTCPPSGTFSPRNERGLGADTSRRRLRLLEDLPWRGRWVDPVSFSDADTRCPALSRLLGFLAGVSCKQGPPTPNLRYGASL